MKIIYSGGFNLEVCKEYKFFIIYNVIDSLIRIIRVLAVFKIDFYNFDRVYDVVQFFVLTGFVESKGEITFELLGVMRRLWVDSGAQVCFGRFSEYYLEDNVVYYLNDLERIVAFDYIFTVEDILRFRDMIIGIVKNKFIFKEFIFKMVDVGGQRLERKKWIYCFEGVIVIIFCVEFSGYDLKFYEDNQTVSVGFFFFCFCRRFLDVGGFISMLQGRAGEVVVWGVRVVIARYGFSERGRCYRYYRILQCCLLFECLFQMIFFFDYFSREGFIFILVF